MNIGLASKARGLSPKMIRHCESIGLLPPAGQHIGELEAKARELLAMKAALEHLVHGCHGDERPDCPILDTLAAG